MTMRKSKKTLQGQVAIITGGGRGIGGAIALSYAREGCTVCLAARTEAELTESAARIRKETGSIVETFMLDVSGEIAVRRMVEEIIAKFAHVDILVCAAGSIQPIGNIEECDSSAWEQVLHVNLLGTLYAVRAVLPSMKAAGRGVIVTFSGAGEKPMPGFSAYASSKAAVVKFTEVLAAEAKAFGISANAIAPGPVNTKIFEDILSTKKNLMSQEQWRELGERKRQGGASMESVCKLALFLASDAGREISGRVLAAQWDDLAAIAGHVGEITQSDMYTMRRIKPEDRGKKW